jgi:hypothetical protein
VGIHLSNERPKSSRHSRIVKPCQLLNPRKHIPDQTNVKAKDNRNGVITRATKIKTGQNIYSVYVDAETSCVIGVCSFLSTSLSPWSPTNRVPSSRTWESQQRFAVHTAAAVVVEFSSHKLAAGRSSIYISIF